MYAELPYELITGSWDDIREDVVACCVQVLQSAVAEHGRAVLAVPGGRSITRVLQALKENSEVPWEQLEIFWVDERWVPLEHSDGNFALIWQDVLSSLVDEGRMHPDQVHPFRFNAELSDGGVGLYQSEFRHYAEQSGERFDLVLLGVGEDGHVASLFPHHEGVSHPGYGFMAVHNSPKPPADRMSASRELIAGSRAAMLLFFGEGKRSALEHFHADGVDADACPARIALQAGSTVVVTDLQQG